MPGRVDQLERARAQGEPLAVLHLVHALGRQGHQLPVQAREAFLAVDELGAGDEFVRVDQVRRAARMQVGARVGQLAQQRARAAGVIQVHVCEQQVVHRRARDLEHLQRLQQVRHREIRADVDEGGAPAVLDQVRGGVSGIQVLRIHGGDAVRVAVQLRFQGNIARSLAVGSRLRMYTS